MNLLKHAAGRSRLVLTLFLLAITITACFSRAAPTPTAAPNTDQPAAAPPTATTSTTNNTRHQNDNGADWGDVQVIEEIADIERYRMRITMVSEAPNRNTDIQVDAAYIKDPPAEEITMQIDDNGEAQTITIVLVDGLRYMRSGDMVVQTTDAHMNLQELTLIQPRDVTTLGNRFTLVGEEMVNERATRHYQGGPDAVPTGGTTGDTFDVTGIDSARIDLWVDQVENFIVAMAIEVTGVGNEPQAHMELHFDYFDFNSPEIMISVPTGAQPADETGNAESTATDAQPRNALGEILGFDLLLATGSEITLASNQIVQVSSIYTLDEAVNLFQTQLPANGYTLMNTITPQAGERVLMFQKGTQITTIQLTATDRGSDWSVVMAP